jgi:MFS family permease
MAQSAAGMTKKQAGVLALLAAAQYVMVIDSTVMNVSIANLVADLDTTVVAIQAAITLFTLVMASTMITGGKLGDILGRRRAFRLGLLVYACGSGLTAVSQNVTTLYFGWSLLEGLGAALILPTLAALVASNFKDEARVTAFGLIAAAAAVAVASGPLLGGAATTYASWRYVFAAEVVACLIIFAFAGRMADAPATERIAFDWFGALLSIVGMALVVLAVLLSSTWGWVEPRPGTPSLAGISATTWFILIGAAVLWGFVRWQEYRNRSGRTPLVHPKLFANRPLLGGLLIIGMQQFILAGAMFALPVFLSIALGLDAFRTGLTLTPLSLGMIVAATVLTRPRFTRGMGPRAIVRLGFGMVLASTLLMTIRFVPEATSVDLLLPLLIMGLGIGMLAGQVANVIQSSVTEESASEAGGLQYTSQYFGSSLGTALIGALLIAGLAGAALTGIEQSKVFTDAQKDYARVSLDGTVSFMSDADLEAALNQTQLTASQKQEALRVNGEARVKALRRAMAAASIFTVIALFFTVLLPRKMSDLVGAGGPESNAQLS